MLSSFGHLLRFLVHGGFSSPPHYTLWGSVVPLRPSTGMVCRCLWALMCGALRCAEDRALWELPCLSCGVLLGTNNKHPLESVCF